MIKEILYCNDSRYILKKLRMKALSTEMIIKNHFSQDHCIRDPTKDYTKVLLYNSSIYVI